MRPIFLGNLLCRFPLPPTNVPPLQAIRVGAISASLRGAEMLLIGNMVPESDVVRRQIGTCGAIAAGCRWDSFPLRV
ncbi:MAG: hypothetical protein SFU86_18875 [Pirellulaceae bacterium]|nr:hypothetical protein [Pirellulaceae bacterium]